MNEDFREFLVDELRQIKEMSEDIRYGYEAGVYDSNTYLLKKYDEFHKPVVVPNFVADWIKETKEKGYPLAYAINCSKGELGKWLHECGTDVETEQNQELFAEAWLEGYTVEEEQRYYVSARDEEYGGFWFLSKNNSGDISIGVNRDWSEVDWESLKLTEEEIKDYDSRYWAFAVKVEEMEE